jgi:endonuclease V-like protein UPF0215 family
VKAVKGEVRILGIDDGHFEKYGPGRDVLVVGAVMRGCSELEGVLSTFVEKDGADATYRLAEMIAATKHRCQLRAVMLSGTTLAGFNIVDIDELSMRTKLPVIAVLRRKPDYDEVRKALACLPGAERRFAISQMAGKIHSYRKVFFQAAGIGQQAAQEIIDATLRKSNLPEPVRIAHMIASGVTTGESTRRA